MLGLLALKEAPCVEMVSFVERPFRRVVYLGILKSSILRTLG